MILADVAVMQPILSSGMFSTSPFFLQNEAKKPAKASESGGDTPTITTLLSLLIYVIFDRNYTAWKVYHDNILFFSFCHTWMGKRNLSE